MARPLRIEYPGALYHVTSRGNRKENIYLLPIDKNEFLEILGRVCARYSWLCYSYCLMDNHYHLLIETPLGNLSQGMKYLNGCYTQYFNKTHKRVGHLFQGRYKSILVEKDTYLLELCRYIVLNPIRALMVNELLDWPWSSYIHTVRTKNNYPWLNTKELLSYFGNTVSEAKKAYIDFVHEGCAKRGNIWNNLKNQIYLGSEQFVSTTMEKLENTTNFNEVPKAHHIQQVNRLPIKHYKESYFNRDESIYHAYQSGHYTMKEIGEFFGLHYSRVSKIVYRIGVAKGKN